MSGRAKKFARGGAAAFAVGVFLAGPQAVAAADSGEDGAGASVAAGDAASAAVKAPASRGAVKSSGSSAGRAAGAGRGARSAPALKAPAPASARAARSVTSVPVLRAVPSSAVAQPVRQPASPVVAVAAQAPAPAAVAAVTATGGRAPVAVRAATAAAGSPTASATAGAAPPAPAVSARDRVVAAEKKFFNTVANWLNGLPASNLTTSLEGALLMVRRNFFNLAPGLTLSPQTTSQKDGKVRGRINAYDLEGDTLSYTVVTAPTAGTVEVLADGRYAYTAGAGFTGTDAFTVAIAQANPGRNVLAPRASTAREVTVNIGGAQTNSDLTDVAVYLPNASGSIQVVKKGLGKRFAATVTLNGVTPDTQLAWLDAAGNRGYLTVEKLATVRWPEFKAKAAENGATIDLTLSYTGADGTQRAVLLNNVAVSKDGTGQYVFTGQLAPNPELKTTSVDPWDVVGKEFKPQYEDFRKAYNIGIGQSGQFKTVNIDFSQAAVFADTYTPASYQLSGGYAQDSEANPQAALSPGGVSAPAALAPPDASAKIKATGVTAAIALDGTGQTFVVGGNDGSVELWTDGQKQQLKDGGWASPVKYILDYDRPLTDALGTPLASSFTGYISGTTLTVTGLGQGSTVVVGSEITGAGVKAGTKITAFVPETGSCTDSGSGSCVGGSGGSNGGPGTYTVSVAQTVGSAIAPESPEDPSKTLPAGVAMSQKNVYAVAPGLVVGLGNGAVELWTASDGWIELHDSGWKAGVTSMLPYGEGFVVGLANGSVQQWNGPGTNPDASTWKNNWTELQNDGWAQPVSGLVSYKSGFIVGLGSWDKTQTVISPLPQTYDGGVEYYDGSKWTEVHDTGWKSGVTSLMAYKDGVVVGLSNGAVFEWDGTVGKNAGWSQLQGTGWGQGVNAMVPFKDGFVVGLGKPESGDLGAVEYYTGKYWIQLHDTGWKSPVTKIVPFDSATVGTGVIVGLDNGTVQLWTGKTAGTNPDSGQKYWTELHDSGWASGIGAIVPVTNKVTDANGNVVFQDGVVVGLDNGALQQWSGLITGPTGQNDWTEIEGPQSNQAAKVLAQDGFLKSAVDFGLALADSGESPVWGADGSVGGAGDPLFSQAIFQEASTANGTYLPVVSYIPGSLIKKTLSDPNGYTNSTVDLSYDVNALAYGYAYVPDGVLAKLVPGKWSMAMLIGLQTGPSLTLNFDSPGTISVPDRNLFNYQYFQPGPLGFDAFAIDVGANAKLDVTLLGAEDKDSLNAHAYMVPGMLFTYNTVSKPKGVQLGFSAYPDIDASDFTSLTGIKVTPTLTPYVTASYGIMAPETTPLIGGWSLFKISLGYENPVSASLCADTTAKCPTATADTGGNLSLTLDSEGYITASAGILDGVTSLLTWDGKYQVYDVSKTFPL